jgi:UDP-N-acetylmuramoylalanine--D-glutamate ligase
MELSGKRVLVAGFGKTGQAVCRFLEDQGAHITVSESRPSSALTIDLGELRERGVRFETGGHTQAVFRKADLIVPSPGIPLIPEIRAALQKGIPVISEVELAFHFLQGRIIGITGSNGKSTVTALLHNILAEAGLPAHLAGNIGFPLISFAKDSRENDLYVTELSSFQLEHTRAFHPHISVLLNITPDHIDWHGSFEAYFSAKKNILTRQTGGEFAVLNRDDPRVWGLRETGPFQVVGFSRKNRPAPGCYPHNNDLILADGEEKLLMPTREIPLHGGHNQENVMAAALAANILEVPLTAIRSGVRSFQALEHRLEEVRTLAGVTFINDSKATNVDAALTAINSFDRPLVLILGGRDKGGDFLALHEAVRARARCVLLIGEARKKIAADLAGSVPLIHVDSLREAVSVGLRQAEPGDLVLLAPACTSFDMFESFEHRGRVFKSEVMKLNKKVVKQHG